VTASKRLKTTLFFSFGLSAVFSFFVYVVQSTASNSVDSCSYLDPITIDILALMAGIFLFVEATIDIIGHGENMLKNQLSRCARMVLGACIVTIHIMQFLHK